MKIIFVMFLFLLIIVTPSRAQDENAGVTPDSPLWGLDIAIERLELFLAGGDTEKVKVGLKHANERLLEVNIMIEKNKLDDAEEAKVKHEEKLREVKEKIKKINGDDEWAIENEVEIEREVEKQEQEIEELKSRIKIKIKGNLTAEQHAALDALIASFANSTNELKLEIKIKRNEIKIKVKQKTNRTDDDIDDEFERHENRTGLNILKKEKAKEQIEDAEEEINDVKEDISEEFGNNNTWPNAIVTLLEQAENHLANAKEAFKMENFGEAYGQANAAEHLAENIEKMIDNFKEDKRGRKDNKTKGSDDEEDEDDNEEEDED